MRYIRKEKVITTICNEDVTENDIVVSVLNNLKNNMIEFSIGIRKYFPSLQYSHKNVQYSKVKVKNVKENEVDFLIFDRSSTTHLNGVLFSDIVEIEAVTTVDKILKSKSDPTRWDFLDIVEE